MPTLEFMNKTHKYGYSKLGESNTNPLGKCKLTIETKNKCETMTISAELNNMLGQRTTDICEDTNKQIVIQEVLK